MTYVSLEKKTSHSFQWLNHTTYIINYTVELFLSYYFNLKIHFPSFAVLFSLSMERKKGRGGSHIEELALVKAAAWAWYQHGSGAEGKPPIREYDLSITQKPPKPSRYKLEAAAAAMIKPREEEDLIIKSSSPSPPLLPNLFNSSYQLNNTNVSLLDKYEVERISMQLDRYIESENNGGGSRRENGKVASLSEIGTSDRKIRSNNCKTKKGKNSKRFWVAICGSRSDVVEALEDRRKVSYGNNTRWPEKNFAAAVKSDNHLLPREGGVHGECFW
ncbi:hypothetical protein M9H77_34104 [Catharanthus roseus]|uniref:Uncharacterized protein n=1 Tax=Catharanthus roseus TaxID=4058 RepID=A0ACB9ZL36_CATRO|nr:hypothetical protein M9H77_34104 [Catharanthus roseus]